MTLFWLLIALLLIVAVAFVVLPILYWRPVVGQGQVEQGQDEQGHAVDERMRLNVGVYRQRLGELEQDLAGEVLDADRYQQLKTELQRNLLSDAERFGHHQHDQIKHSLSNRIQIPLILILVPLISWLVYGKIGAIKDWDILNSMNELMVANAGEQQSDTQHQRLIDALENRLADKPDDIQYLVMLARSYMRSNDFEKASLQYAKLVELLPDDPDAIAYYAQSIFLAKDRRIDAEVQRAIDRALVLNPHNLAILGLIGIDAFEKKEYQKAVTAWQQALAGLAKDSPDRIMLQQGIGAARRAAQEAGITLSEKGVSDHRQFEGDGGAAERDAGAGATLSVTVSLADGLLAKADQTVFIFAKASKGPPMPLAVQKVKVADLPLTVTLDDSMSMMPNMTLSSYPEVFVVARISSSGGVDLKPGDLEGKSAVIKVAETGQINLKIDRLVE